MWDGALTAVVVVEGKRRKRLQAEPGSGKVVRRSLVRQNDGLSGHISSLSVTQYRIERTLGNPVDPLECTMNTGNGPSCSGVNARGYGLTGS